MGEEAAAGRYEPGPSFEEVKEEAMLDLSPTDSKEFWLIQWIKDKDLDASNFHVNRLKDLSVQPPKDGNLGSLVSSSGKCYDLVSFAYQQPNAAVFLPSGSETKFVGKISRRVCLVRGQKQEEVEEPEFRIVTRSIAKSAAEKMSHQVRLVHHRKHEELEKPQCPVVIDGLTFESPEDYHEDYHTVKTAEMAAAKLALASLPEEARSHDQCAGSSRNPLANNEKGYSMKPLAKKKKRSRKKSVSRFIAEQTSKCSSSVGLGHSVGTMSVEHNNVGHSDVSGKASEGPHALGAQSNTAMEMLQPEKPLEITDVSGKASEGGPHALGAQSNTAMEMPQPENPPEIAEQ